MSNPLAKFSTDALLEELARRRRVRSERQPIAHWCEDCKHFKFWTAKSDPPDTYNPCSKGHTMSFRQPEDYGDEMGYYRRVCADRARMGKRDE